MRMKKTILMGGLVALGAGLAIGAIASANPDMFQRHNGESLKKGFNMTEEKKEAVKEHYEQMEEILTNGDYEAFKELMAEKPMLQNITEENFAKFIEMHNLKKAGDMEGAKAIAEELGLEGFGKKGMKRGMHKRASFVDNNGDGVCDNLDKK